MIYCFQLLKRKINGKYLLEKAQGLRLTSKLTEEYNKNLEESTELLRFSFLLSLLSSPGFILFLFSVCSL